MKWYFATRRDVQISIGVEVLKLADVFTGETLHLAATPHLPRG